ncbi:MAG TPA: hypothetical protein PLT68_00315 [Actinomycetota bacterium]|nr:hypothetical protein [Actinomycetota bacterium]
MANLPDQVSLGFDRRAPRVVPLRVPNWRRRRVHLPHEEHRARLLPGGASTVVCLIGLLLGDVMVANVSPAADADHRQGLATAQPSDDFRAAAQ